MKDNKKKKVIILIIIFTIILFLGATYSIVVDYLSKTGKNSSLVVGDIYMHYNEGRKQISLSNAMPSNTYSSDYFEFTVDGKNTSNKNINYLISLSYGDTPSNRTTRIKDNLLDFKLVEVVNNQENVLVDTINFNSLTNANLYTTTIPSNTNNYLKTYRLYMKISYNTVGFDTAYNAVFPCTKNTTTKKYIYHSWDDSFKISEYRFGTKKESIYDNLNAPSGYSGRFYGVKVRKSTLIYCKETGKLYAENNGKFSELPLSTNSINMQAITSAEIDQLFA